MAAGEFSQRDFEKSLRRIMRGFLKQYSELGGRAIAAILAKLGTGRSVRAAIDAALAETGFDERLTDAIADAACLAACDGYGALPAMVAAPEGIKGKLLAESWTGDGDSAWSVECGV